MRLYSVRGATCALNTKESILQSVEELSSRMLSENGIKTEDIVNIQFTVTSDLNALNPATAFRKASLSADVSSVPLFCSAEPEVCGMLPRVIRMMITCYAESAPQSFVYINGAEVLRPDLCKKA